MVAIDTATGSSKPFAVSSSPVCARTSAQQRPREQSNRIVTWFGGDNDDGAGWTAEASRTRRHLLERPQRVGRGS